MPNMWRAPDKRARKASCSSDVGPITSTQIQIAPVLVLSHEVLALLPFNKGKEGAMRRICDHGDVP
jgi:hypothetical protein